jgi:hypothetical protein
MLAPTAPRRPPAPPPPPSRLACRVECRSADDVVRAVAKAAAGLASCSKGHLALLRALRGPQGRPQQEALEAVARAITSGQAWVAAARPGRRRCALRTPPAARAADRSMQLQLQP